MLPTLNSEEAKYSNANTWRNFYCYSLKIEDWDATRVSRKTWVASPETQIAPPAAIPAAPAGRAVRFRNERRVIRFGMVDLPWPPDVGRVEPRHPG